MQRFGISAQLGKQKALDMLLQRLKEVQVTSRTRVRPARAERRSAATLPPRPTLRRSRLSTSAARTISAGLPAFSSRRLALPIGL